MSPATQTCGPYTFAHRRKNTRPSGCDTPGCSGSAIWHATTMGYPLGSYCGACKALWTATTAEILQLDTPAVAA